MPRVGQIMHFDILIYVATQKVHVKNSISVSTLRKSTV